MAISNTIPRDTENIKKEIFRIFNHNGLRITIEANKQTINFLDVTFNLNKNTTLQYVHRESTTHQLPQRTYPTASTKDCHPLHLTKYRSTKPLLHTKKHSTNADTSTLYTTNHPRLTNEKTDNTTI